MNEQIKTAIYARESSKDITKAPPIQNQIDRAMQFVRDHNFYLVDLFEDNGFSGGDWKRPGLNSMLKCASANRFKFLIVWNTDRIARDLLQFADIFSKLNEKNIKVYSICEGWVDMQTAGGRFKNNMVAAFNQYEREKTGEKVRMAYQMKKKKDPGLNWGRKSCLTNEQKKEILKRSGEWPSKIKKDLGLSCSIQTIRRVLQNTHAKNKRNSSEEMIENIGLTE